MKRSILKMFVIPVVAALLAFAPVLSYAYTEGRTTLQTSIDSNKTYDYNAQKLGDTLTKINDAALNRFSDGVGRFTICGEATTINNNTVYYGPDRTLVSNTSGLSCDINATGNTTEATADATIVAKNIYIMGMTCRNEGDANADISFTLRDNAGATTPSVTCTIADNSRDCTADIQTTSAIFSGHQVAIAAASTANVADNNGFICEVFYSY